MKNELWPLGSNYLPTTAINQPEMFQTEAFDSVEDVWTDDDCVDAQHWPTTEKIQLSESDIISFHDYSWPEKFESRVVSLKKLHRPLLCTEYMARGAGSAVDTILPIAIIHRAGMVNWGRVQGKMQMNVPWDSWDVPYVGREPKA
jgi:hypothetical protein